MSVDIRIGANDVAPQEPACRCLPMSAWPPLDRAAWEASCIAGDPLDPGGLASRWAPLTRRVTANGYGRWLGWLDGQDKLDLTVGPAARIDREIVGQYARYLATVLSPVSVASYIQQLFDALRAMTEGHDWSWIMRASWRMRELAIPVREKRSRMQTPDRLADLGKKIMAAADLNCDEDPIEAATRFRNGLIIAFLAFRPIRMGNLAAIKCGQHLIAHKGIWRVAFAGHEVKNRRPLEFPFPTNLVPYLEQYLGCHRPVLLGIDGHQESAFSGPLWVSKHGTSLGSETIAHHIRRHTEAEFGLPINPHLFRDCAATTIAIVDPEHVEIIAAILGHASMTTSERHYIQAKGLEAGRLHGNTLDDLQVRTKRRRRAATKQQIKPRQLPSAKTQSSARQQELTPQSRESGRDKTIVTQAEAPT
jgi:integrase/recombinase XerD